MFDARFFRVIEEEAQKWPGRRLLRPGPAGGRPALYKSFLEAAVDEWRRNRHGKASSFAGKMIPTLARYHRLRSDGHPLLYPFRATRSYPVNPDMRSQVLEVFPSSGEARIREYARRAVVEHLVQAWRVEDGSAVDFLELTHGKPPSVSVVPDLLYSSSLPEARA